MRNNPFKDRLVYSTEQGRICPNCSAPVDRCFCKRQRPPPPADGVVRVSRETKGRKGKGVTVITGIELSPPELKKLATELKQRCSTGGSVKNGTIEIQGDQRKTLEQVLQTKGYTVKISGG